MSCRTVRFSCPIGAEACTWTVECCDGTKYLYALDENRTEDLCLSVGSTILLTSQYGSWNDINQNCSTNCGAADETPIAGYEYYEFDDCNSGAKQIFRAALSGPVLIPNVVRYNSECWQNPTLTNTTSNVDISSLQGFVDCASCAGVPTPPKPPSPPTPGTLPEYCLIQTNSVTVRETDEVEIPGGVTIPAVRLYLFNGAYGLYQVQLGQYTLSNVPSAHPIAILNYGVESLISYTGQFNAGTKTSPDGYSYTYYYGDITINVNGDFGAVSYACYFHGYMGGENNLVYESTCPSPTDPTPVAPSPTPAPTSVVPPIPSPVDTEWTLSYSDNSQGWPSFYSFNPDYMIGMNNFFYTFKGGNLYQHNTNELRNNYYGEQFNSQISSVFNLNPLENKIFKTINLESDNAWQAYMETDIQQNGIIEDSWFEKKEGAWFAYVRQEGNVPAFEGQYAMRSANGIGKTSNVSVDGGLTTLSFSTDPLVSIGNIISIGDYVYHSLPQYTEVTFGGVVTNIEVDLRNGINRLYVSTNYDGAVAFPLNDPYIMFLKSSEAESHGLLGHYCIFTIVNVNTNKTELFAVESDVMKSYP